MLRNKSTSVCVQKNWGENQTDFSINMCSRHTAMLASEMWKEECFWFDIKNVKERNFSAFPTLKDARFKWSDFHRWQDIMNQTVRLLEIVLVFLAAHIVGENFHPLCQGHFLFVHTYRYSCIFNTSHTLLGDMPNFYKKLVCITRHAIPLYQRPGWKTENTNSELM